MSVFIIIKNTLIVAIIIIIMTILQSVLCFITCVVMTHNQHNVTVVTLCYRVRTACLRPERLGQCEPQLDPLAGGGRPPPLLHRLH